jgi:hypothetical protein
MTTMMPNRGRKGQPPRLGKPGVLQGPGHPRDVIAPKFGRFHPRVLSRRRSSLEGLASFTACSVAGSIHSGTSGEAANANRLPTANVKKLPRATPNMVDSSSSLIPGQDRRIGNRCIVAYRFAKAPLRSWSQQRTHHYYATCPRAWEYPLDKPTPISGPSYLGPSDLNSIDSQPRSERRRVFPRQP